MKKYADLQPDDIRRLMERDTLTEQECEDIITFTKEYCNIIVSSTIAKKAKEEEL